MTDTKIQGKFYPLKHEEWVKAFKELTDSEKGVLYYLRSLDPYNNGLKVRASKIASDLEISRQAVYKAFDVLEEKGYISREDVEYTLKIQSLGILVDSSITDTQLSTPSDSVNVERQLSTLSDSCKRSATDVNVERQLPAETPVQQESQIPKINKTFQDFSNTLSLEEKESFFEVGEKMAASLPRPPQLTRKWIEKNWEEVAAKWRKQTQREQPKNSKWEIDPRTPVWLEEIELSGNPAQFSSKNKEKQDFVSWCWDNKKFSWLQEE
jgi:biotin operon repressor